MPQRQNGAVLAIRRLYARCPVATLQQYKERRLVITRQLIGLGRQLHGRRGRPCLEREEEAPGEEPNPNQHCHFDLKGPAAQLVAHL
jgi:hypothetical protein